MASDGSCRLCGSRSRHQLCCDSCPATQSHKDDCPRYPNWAEIKMHQERKQDCAMCGTTIVAVYKCSKCGIEFTCPGQWQWTWVDKQHIHVQPDPDDRKKVEKAVHHVMRVCAGAAQLIPMRIYPYSEDGKDAKH